MKVMDVLERIKHGEKIMVTLSQRASKPLYNLTDGTEVSEAQFLTIKPFIAAGDKSLLEGAEPLSYVWAG
ncbi:hypothetical protein [Ruegeria sp. HKCCD6109]|uniref:hypothetical protein n=1 Tax=Ruegeria sp. HKCCD6109 TaxID=2683017 RepID=UPI0014924236|nr:hypothetical protein [Ruegeria sp. HKCCD6109]NOD65793.1 hypothetical protein [Ruegeria sp. HKCCD6109]